MLAALKGVFNMFAAFKKTIPLAQLQRQAMQKYESVLEESATHKGRRRPRIQMAMLCRAFLDRTFIDGAEQSLLYIDQVTKSAHSGAPMPKDPKPKTYQRVASSVGPVWTYAPDMYANEAFAFGRAYQSMEIDAHEAIDNMQALLDRLCMYELRLDESITALQFLREQVAVDFGYDSQQASGPAAKELVNQAVANELLLATVVPHIKAQLSSMGLSDAQIAKLQKLGMLNTHEQMAMAA